MQRLFSILLAISLLLTLAACVNNTASTPVSSTAQETSSAAETEPTADSVPEPTSEPETESESVEIPAEEIASEAPQSNSNILVVYFSCIGEQYEVGVIDKGNTEIVAEMVADGVGADLYEITPAEDYPLTYNELTDVAQQELRESARPSIAGELPDLSGYDTVFIGAPVWWGDWPMICYTFFESADLSGKTLYPFSTHGGSGLSGFDSKLQNASPGASVGKGLAIRGADCQNDPVGVQDKVDNWLNEIGY